MKVVILAGGLGTRITEESQFKPKPMIEIAGKPMLWHIMKIYSHFGFNEFVVCLGYKAEVIKEYFANYYLHTSDVTFDMNNNDMQVHNSATEPWKVTLCDTGLETMTGGRLKRVQPYVGNETFMLTYGDGVSDCDIPALLSYHQQNGRSATITAVQPGGRFGALGIDEKSGAVATFAEKQQEDGGWINGGFMVLEPAIFDLLSNDTTILEREPLEQLATSGQLDAFKHSGFWQCMDTLRDKQQLEELWNANKAPWKLWG